MIFQEFLKKKDKKNKKQIKIECDKCKGKRMETKETFLLVFICAIYLKKKNNYKEIETQKLELQNLN